LDARRNPRGYAVGQPRHPPGKRGNADDKAEDDRRGNGMGMAFKAIDHALQAVLLRKPLVEQGMIVGEDARAVAELDRARDARQPRRYAQAGCHGAAVDAIAENANRLNIEALHLDLMQATALAIEIVRLEFVHRPMSMSNRPSTSAAVASTPVARSASMSLKSSAA